MKCRNPFIRGGTHAFGCGQCVPCRIKVRRTWANRIQLEAGEHSSNCFLTLTYCEDALPRTTSGLSTLNADDHKNFLKRLRTSIAPIKLRFFAVGEYGDESWRPHLHYALFGAGECARGGTVRSRGRPMADRCCEFCRLVSAKWGYGDVDVGILDQGRAQYLAKYVTKKMTRGDDPRLQDRYQEFSRKSLKPGLGFNALHEIASTVMQYELEHELVDVPGTICVGSRRVVLGRYLTQNLRRLVGKEKDVPEAVLERLAAEMLPLRLAAKESADAPSLKSQILNHFAQQVLQVEARAKIRKSKEQL